MILLQDKIEELGINYFNAFEVRHGQNVPPELEENILPTLYIADKMREAIGVPLRVTSSYRDKEFNRQCGGAKNSLHLKFNALDLMPWCNLSKLPLLLAFLNSEFCYRVEWKGKVIKLTKKVIGVGRYDKFIHLDTRGLMRRKAPAYWDERKSK